MEAIRLEEGRNNWIVADATTDAEGRYRIPARPGKIMIQATKVPETYLGLEYGEYPRLEVKDDRTWPELTLAPATSIDGVVVDGTGRPVHKAAVYLLAPEPGRVLHPELVQTGPDGAFHFDGVDPDDKLSLWAGARDSTTNGTVVVRPRDVKGKVTLTIDPSHTVRIRGLLIDGRGRRVSGARLMLRLDAAVCQ